MQPRWSVDHGKGQEETRLKLKELKESITQLVQP